MTESASFLLCKPAEEVVDDSQALEELPKEQRRGDVPELACDSDSGTITQRPNRLAETIAVPTQSVGDQSGTLRHAVACGRVFFVASRVCVARSRVDLPKSKSDSVLVL